MINFDFKNEKFNVRDFIRSFDQIKLFEYFLNEEVLFNTKYTNPFRTDTNPGCFFSESDDCIIYFNDYSYNPNWFDIIDFIKLGFNCTFNESIDIINDLESKGYVSKNPIVDTLPIKKSIIKTSDRYYLRYLPKPDYSNRDLEYWSKYGITKDQLISDGVFSVDLYEQFDFKNNLYTAYKNHGLMFAYTDFTNNGLKLYSPLNRIKWRSNLNKNDLGNINKIDYTKEYIILTKSYKDTRVLKNLGLTNVIWCQSETSFNEETIKELFVQFKRPIVFFDNDNAGITSAINLSNFIKEKIGRCDNIHLPINLLSEKIKDISDLYESKGIYECLTFLKQVSLDEYIE